MKSIPALDQNDFDATGSTPPRRALNRRGPAPLALEPRVMFDGATADAAVAAAKAAAADIPAERVAEHAPVEQATHAAAAVLPPETQRHEVVFIEDNVRDYQKLAAAVTPGVEVVVLDHTKDGLQQMIAALDGRAPVDAIHVVSHGAQGRLELGTSIVDSANVDSYGAQLAQLGQHMNAGADLMLYGCTVAAGEPGTAFIDRIGQLTGADVAASTDLTGSRAFGADWDLEAHTGSIERPAMALDRAGWSGVLENETVFNANWQALTFDGKDALIGTGAADGDVVRFNSVITINGQAIDAVVTTTIKDATIGDYDSIKNPSPNTAFFQPTLTTTKVGGNATFTIAFYLHGTHTQTNEGVAVTLQNVVVNSYDIDSLGNGADRQFQSFKGFARYELSNSTQLVPTVQSDGTVTFLYTSKNPVNNANVYADGFRVRVYYDSMSNFQVNAGVAGATAQAFFAFDFSVGPAWGGPTTITGNPAPSLGYSDTTFVEAGANDGSISTTSTITLTNGSFAGTDGQELTDVNFANLPTGLTASVTRVDATHATLSFTGNAAAHANANDVNNFGVTFGNGAFASGNAGAVTGASRADLKIDFNDPPADNAAPIVNTGQAFDYAENRGSAAGPIGTVKASDDTGVTGFQFADSQKNTTSDGWFTIDASGHIGMTDAGRAAAANDYEQGTHSFVLAVQARDAAGNWSKATDVTLNLTNVDELAPAFTSVTTASAVENQSVLYTAAATDVVDYTDHAVTYGIKPNVGDAAALVIDSTTGRVSLASGKLDFETKSSYSFIVTARDATGNVGEQAVTVSVTDVDEVPPTVVITTTNPGVPLRAGDTRELLFTFSEAVDDSFTAADVRLDSGSIGPLTRIDASHFTATYTPGDNVESGSVQIRIDSGSFADLAHNINVAPATLTLAVDTVAPHITGPDNATGASSALSVPEGTSALHTFTASESVTWSLAGGEDAARFTISPSGALSFIGAPDYEAPQDGATDGRNTYLVQVRAVDAAGNATIQSVKVSVTNVNELPVAAPDSFVTAEDTAWHGQLPAASDPDHDIVTYAKASDPAHGTVSIEADGSYTYTPVTDYHGSDSFTYTIEDGNGGSRIYTVSVTVTPVNDAPTAADAAITTLEDTIKTGTLPQAHDVDGDTVTYAKAADPAHGTVSIEADGSYTYKPAADYNGKDSFSYTVSDGQGGSNTYTVEVTVTPVNDAPVAGNASIATPEDTPKTGTLPQGRDVDGEPFTYTKESDPAHGTVTIGTDGSYTYTPATDYNGPDSFTYTISDGHGGKNTYTVDVTVGAVNDAPTAADAAITTLEDTTKTGMLPQAHDVDGDTVTYAKAGDPAHGTVSIEADGSYTYKPAADYNGKDSFSYTVSDGHGGSNTYTVEVTVTPVNDAPVAHGGGMGRGTVGEPMDPVAVPAFTDIDGPGITYTAVQADGSPLPSWLVFDPATHSFEGTPPKGSVGTWTIVVSGSDGSLRADTTVTIEVGNPAAPRQSPAITSMTKDTGASPTDFVTGDGSAGRTVSGTIGAPLGHNEVLQVSFDGGSTWSTAKVDGGTWSAVDNGAHSANWTIEARVTNTAAGLSGPTVSREVVLDTTPPAAPAVDSITTTSTTPVLHGGATVGTGEILRVTVNGATYEVPVQDGRWTLDLASAKPVSGSAVPLTVGQNYDVTATVTDLAGNVRDGANQGLVSVSPPALVLAPPPAVVQAAAPVAPAVPAPTPVPEPTPVPMAMDSRVRSDSAAPGSLASGDNQQFGYGQGIRATDTAAIDVRGAALSDIYTRTEGFRTVVAKAEEPALVLFQGVPDQFAEAGASLSLTVPADAFAHTQPKAIVRLTAIQQDGRPLPAWVQFNGQTGQFTGEVPKGLQGELKIKLVARDMGGREAAALFRINLGQQRALSPDTGAAPAGKPGLSTQLRAGARGR